MNRTSASILRRLVGVLIEEADRNPVFADRLEQALGGAGTSGRPQKRPHRRPAGLVDPFTVFADSGEAGVRAELIKLSVEQLKDIVAQHGMDRSKLAMKWKTTDRFVDLILETVAARSRKGDAFLA